MNSDNKWMHAALQEALIAQDKGEVPVGAVIIQNNKIISKGHNCPITNNDATAHAEIMAIRSAGKKMKNYRLSETTLYVTLEPCTMCVGAIMHARINRIVFGASDKKNGVCSSSINLTSEKIFNHKVIVESGVLEEKCRNLIHSFFKMRR